MIAEYLDKLTAELAFDPALSHRVRREVEDHLREAVAAERQGGPDAERRALARFGDAREIAARFAVGSIGRRARRVGATAVLLIAAVFAAMKARLVWYGLLEYPVGNPALIVTSIDRYAFWLAGIAGVSGWIYIGSRGTPLAFTGEFQAELRRFSLLCSAAALALIVSVASDGVLASLRIAGMEWSAASWLPLFSVGVEVACASLLVSRLRLMVRRTALIGGSSGAGR